MDEVAAQIEERRARVERAERARLQAEAALDSARAAVGEVARLLQEEFGITPEQVRELRAQLERQYTEELAQVDSILSGAGL